MKKWSLLFILATNAWAGNGWVSSGGEFRKDQNNPWFVKNSKQVNWCLIKSNQFVSLETARVRELVELALGYWTSEFQNLDSSSGIGQQRFIFTGEGCTRKEELQIKIGHDTLSSEELEYISTKETDLEQHAGLTIRKTYDLELRGQGTIYIASDKGPRRFLTGRGVPESFWRDEGIFLRVLVHELGHLFGLPHEAGGLMAAAYPEETIRRSREQHFDDTRRIDNLPPTFAFQKNQTLCMESYAVNLPGINSNCFKLNWNQNSLQISDLDSKIEIPLIGGATMISLDFPVTIFLPKGQSVFPTYPENSFLRGPARVAYTISTRIEEFKTNVNLFLNPVQPQLMIMSTKKADRVSLRIKGSRE